ncbi:MAG TPA: retropepsin-like aspartic protease [Hyphomonadaceae bacterium]|nr:retropepsin-like aspartic protease [Hyphomonadaceae bacterium]
MAPVAFTRRSLLGAVPALGLASSLAGNAFGQVTGSRLAQPDERYSDVSLDAWVDVYGRPTAKVMLNGQGPFSFMVDTGSTTTVIAERHVKALAAPIIGMMTVNGTTGTSDTPMASLANLETGVVTKKDIRVAVLSDYGLGREDGILGADVFAGKRLSFDIPAKSVRVEPSRREMRRLNSVTNMRVRNGLLAEIDGSIGRVSAKLMLDTGAQNCIANPVLSEALLKAYPHLVRHSNVSVVGVTGQVITGDYLELPKIDFKEFAVKDSGAVVADAPIFRIWGLDREPAMIVGVNLLSRLSTFSIDYGAREFDARLLADMIARSGQLQG